MKALILTGRNNHDWQATTPPLKEMFEASGRFEVDVTEDPAAFDAESLVPYDLLISNWGGFPDVNERQWGPTMEAAFEDFIRQGKGFLLFHAANTSFHTWDEYQNIIGGTWGEGTGHGPHYTSRITITDDEHPVTSGMPDFYIAEDEVWHGLDTRPHINLLATVYSREDRGGSGQEEPAVLWTRFGEGRCFHVVPGHDARVFRNAGWRTLMLRGGEWAATGEVTLPIPLDAWPDTEEKAELALLDVDQALEAVAGWQFGQNRGPLEQARRLVHGAVADAGVRETLVPGLLALMSSDAATADARRFALEMLSLVADEEDDAVAAVAVAALSDAELVVEALLCLERLPGAGALAAMGQALDQTEGPARLGLVRVLGRRGAMEAEEAFIGLLTSDDEELVVASAEALSALGTLRALRALSRLFPLVGEGMQHRLAPLLIACATSEALQEDAAARDDRLAALTLVAQSPGPLRPAAMARAQIEEKDGDREAIAAGLFRMLTSDDANDRQAGLFYLQNRLPPIPAIGPLIRMMSSSLDGDSAIAELAGPHPPGQWDVADWRPVLMTLTQLPSHQVADLAAKLLDPERDRDLRLLGLQAQEALRMVGSGGREVIFNHIPWADEEERAAVRAMYSAARWEMADHYLLDWLWGKLHIDSSEDPEDHDKVKVEVVRILAERDSLASGILLEEAQRQSAVVRQAILEVMPRLANSRDVEALVRMLAEVEDETERGLLERSLITAIRRSDTTGSAMRRALVAAGVSDAPALRQALARVAGVVRGQVAMEALLMGIHGENPDVVHESIRGLSQWGVSDPVNPLLELAGTTEDTRARALALRGVAQLVARTDMAPGQKVYALDQALARAERLEDKGLLIQGLAGLHEMNALNRLLPYLDDPDLRDVTSRAIIDGAGAMARAGVQENDGRKTAGACLYLQRVLARTTDTALLKAATAPLLEAQVFENLTWRASRIVSTEGHGPDGQGGPPEAAIDGDLSTYWDEVDGHDQYGLRLYFGPGLVFDTVRITAYQHHQFAPRDFELYANEQLFRRVENAQYQDNVLTLTVPPTSASILEIRITGYYGGSPAIRALELFNREADAGSLTYRQRPDSWSVYHWLLTDHALALRHGDRLVWQAVFDPSEGKPFFHPLALTDGNALTWLRPADHVWHRGHWFSWKYINGLNYWEENPATGLSDGRTTVVSADVVVQDDFSARLTYDLAYHPPDADPVLTERRIVTVSCPDDEGRYMLDWDCLFTAGDEEVVLDRTLPPHEPGGQSWGGYAGLSMRMVQSGTDWEAISDSGRQDRDMHGQRDRWIAMSARLTYGIEGGVAILDHPENPRHPTPWYVTMDAATPFYYFSPSPLFESSMTLAPGESLRLRYRVLVFPGRTDPEWIEAQWEAM